MRRNKEELNAYREHIMSIGIVKDEEGVTKDIQGRAITSSTVYALPSTSYDNILNQRMVSIGIMAGPHNSAEALLTKDESEELIAHINAVFAADP